MTRMLESAPLDPGHLDRTGYPLHRGLTRLRHLELPVRGGHGVGAGQDLSSLGERRDPGSLVHLSPAVVLAAADPLPGMHPDAHERGEPVRPAVLRQGTLDDNRARERGTGILESHEEPVARVMSDLP